MLAINPEVRGMAETIHGNMAQMLVWFERDQAALNLKDKPPRKQSTIAR